MSDDELWKRRFLAFGAARIGGVALILFGLAVAFTDLVRPDGFRGLGALLKCSGVMREKSVVGASHPI